MAPQDRLGADVEQARYFAAELERWADKLEAEVSQAGQTARLIAAKQYELDDVHRQLKALRNSFPGAFVTS
ncbi:hypothetical protein [Williamsia sp.]|uniref:hypothetical protein n=1 Tax=Williamsia sp. TaxID=1872085 RepID=UPI002F953F6E